MVDRFGRYVKPLSLAELTFFIELMFFTVSGARPGLYPVGAPSQLAILPPIPHPWQPFFDAGGGPSLNTRPTCEGGVASVGNHDAGFIYALHMRRGITRLCQLVGKNQIRALRARGVFRNHSPESGYWFCLHTRSTCEGVPTVVIRDGKGNSRAPRARGGTISFPPYFQNLGYPRFFQAASTGAAAVAPRIRYLSKLVIP